MVKGLTGLSPTKCLAFCVLCLAGGLQSLWADDWADDLYVNAFYTLDSTYSDNPVSLVSNHGNLRPYEGEQLNAENSLVGGQLRYDFSPAVSVYVQGTGFFRPDGSFTTAIDWAYVSADLGADTTVRAGKFQIPLMQGTELRSIGFTRLWARPLVPGDGAGGFNAYSGVEILKYYGDGLGDWDFQAALGKPEHDLDSQIHGDSLGLVSARYKWDRHWLRAALMYTQYEVSTPGGLLLTDSGEGQIASVEGEAWFGNVVANAGLSDSRTEIIPDDRLLYLSLGYRYEALTPFASVSRREQHFDPFTLPSAVRPPPPGPPGPPGPNPGPPPPPGPRTTPSGSVEIDSFAMGVRWDFNDSHSLKFQIEKSRIDDNVVGRAPSPSDVATAVSIVLEGVF